MAKWEPFIFRETNLYHWIYSPVFTIQCTTVFELRQRKIADCFTKKKHFTAQNFEFCGLGGRVKFSGQTDKRHIFTPKHME